MIINFNNQEVLKEYNGTLYLMIGIRIILSSSKFEYRAMPINVIVKDDNNNMVCSFMAIISGNQKELLAYFTVDAFNNFSNNSEIKFGYGFEDDYEYFTKIVDNYNIHNVSPLPSILANIPHHIADNNWLNNLQ